MFVCLLYVCVYFNSSAQIRKAILQGSRQKSAGFNTINGNGYHSDPETPDDKSELANRRGVLRARLRKSHDPVATSKVEQPPKSPVSNLDGDLRQKTERVLSYVFVYRKSWGWGGGNVGIGGGVGV